MKIFVCRVCGEVYIGENIPHSCPFCGVAKKNMRLASVWEDENAGVEIGEISRGNLQKALELELSNATFYKSASKKLKSLEHAKMFKGLFKVEKEHAEVYQKLLNLQKLPDIIEEAPESVKECVEESLARERRAVAFYDSAAKAATEPRVKYVFEEIGNVEKDHVKLDEAMNK